MNNAYINAELENILKYTENDFKSYQVILALNKFISSEYGSCSVGMICHAMAVIDYLGYLFYGGTVESRIKKVLECYHSNCPQSEWKKILSKPKKVYDILRNGVVHQFYGKNTSITSNSARKELIWSENGEYILNAYAFYELTIDIIKFYMKDIDSRIPNDLNKINERINTRKKNDENAIEGLKGQIPALPIKTPEPTQPPRHKFRDLPNTY